LGWDILQCLETTQKTLRGFFHYWEVLNLVRTDCLSSQVALREQTFFFKLVKTDLGIKILFLVSEFSNVLFVTNAITSQFSQPEYQISRNY
jgi:hypothetical protein